MDFRRDHTISVFWSKLMWSSPSFNFTSLVPKPAQRRQKEPWLQMTPRKMAASLNKKKLRHTSKILNK